MDFESKCGVLTGPINGICDSINHGIADTMGKPNRSFSKKMSMRNKITHIFTR